MLNLTNLLNYSKNNLTLSEIVVLETVKISRMPTTIQKILETIKFTVKKRQLSNILTKLEHQNMFVKFRLKNGFLFLLPFLKNQKGNLMRFKKHNSKTNSNFKLKHAIFFLRGFIYKNINNKRKYHVINFNNKHNEEETTFNKEQKLVFNKTVYKQINELKTQFRKDFPTKNAFINTTIPKNFDYCLLKQKILESDFLTKKDNLGFSWLIKNYDAIVNDYYKTNTQSFINKTYNGFQERTYSKEELDFLWD